MTSLYAIDKTGRIRVFTIELIPGSGTMTIRTNTGVLGGNLTDKDRVISIGKSGRDLGQQAELKFMSLIKEKVDEGYHSLKDLENRATSLNLL